jgi:hypothetical protein
MVVSNDRDRILLAPHAVSLCPRSPLLCHTVHPYHAPCATCSAGSYRVECALLTSQSGPDLGPCKLQGPDRCHTIAAAVAAAARAIWLHADQQHFVQPGAAAKRVQLNLLERAACEHVLLAMRSRELLLLCCLPFCLRQLPSVQRGLPRVGVTAVLCDMWTVSAMVACASDTDTQHAHCRLRPAICL